MNKRYRITRNKTEDNQSGREITLEECKAFFATQPDFRYTNTYSVRSADTVMTIEGEFFMWQVGEGQIPFRYYEGDVYVAVSHEVIYEKMLEVAQGLHAAPIEG